jgi:hypothetical protein
MLSNKNSYRLGQNLTAHMVLILPKIWLLIAVKLFKIKIEIDVYMFFTMSSITLGNQEMFSTSPCCCLLQQFITDKMDANKICS